MGKTTHGAYMYPGAPHGEETEVVTKLTLPLSCFNIGVCHLTEMWPDEFFRLLPTLNLSIISISDTPRCIEHQEAQLYLTLGVEKVTKED